MRWYEPPQERFTSWLAPWEKRKKMKGGGRSKAACSPALGTGRPNPYSKYLELGR